ncbi:hypothetical protein CDL12_16962 [Handroanthus impetiginosus]|uniref:Secreted protein n=1 Tax=Handroanthus impetiginosus TaxID=429701 RepID=A0A2G9GZK7_9LAMI|nr:hypothetical protein CDL12_16962 [Handroanthus impetiginosus]
MIWHKNMATLFLILLFGAMAFTTPSQADNFSPCEGPPISGYNEENTSPSLSEEQMNQQLIRWPWKKSPPPPYWHLPPAGQKPPKAPWWKPWKKSPPRPKPPRRPWWKPPCCGRKKSPPQPAF